MDDTQIKELVDAILGALKTAKYQECFQEALPDGFKKPEAVVVSFNNPELIDTYGESLIVDVNFDIYNVKTGNKAAPKINKQLGRLNPSNKQNLRSIFQYSSTRVNLPYSSELWFIDKAISYSDKKIGELYYRVESHKGKMTINFN